MKQLSSFVLFVFGIIISMNAQELKVLEFRADKSMTDAVRNPMEDFNGSRCGLIKLGLIMPDATFEGDIIGTPKYKNGEWLIYMIKDANWLVIKSKNSLPLRCEFADYGIKGIQSNVTYVMNVEVPNSPNSVSALWRSAIFPGWGQGYKGMKGKGWLIGIGETLSLTAGGFSLYKTLYWKNERDKPEVSYQDSRAADECRKQWLTATCVTFGIAGVIYLANLADAYWTPAKQKKSYALYPDVMNMNGEMAVGLTMSISL